MISTTSCMFYCQKSEIIVTSSFIISEQMMLLLAHMLQGQGIQKQVMALITE